MVTDFGCNLKNRDGPVEFSHGPDQNEARNRPGKLKLLMTLQFLNWF